MLKRITEYYAKLSYACLAISDHMAKIPVC